MAETVGGFPFWTIEFRKDGHLVDSRRVDAFIGEVAAQQISDLFIFSHGWNNDRAVALTLYELFFEQVRRIYDDGTVPKKRDGRIGVAGVIWPSILWPDDAPHAASAGGLAGNGGGAASFVAGPPAQTNETTPGEINRELKKAYDDVDQMALVDDLTAMLEQKPNDENALIAFREKVAALLGSEPTDSAVDRREPDSAEGAIAQLTDSEWLELLETVASESRSAEMTGGAAGLDDAFERLWSGAKDVLRIGTYWQMKQRAGIVGRKGLGAIVLASLAKNAPGIRVHLMGHSFGARLVSFSLAGMPPALTGAASPVKSLFLLQGAFSHFAFADELPHDATRGGALKGMAARVDGPLVTTHSLKDLAVGISYPAASFLNRDDAAAAADEASRWGAMGHDGAQAVGAADHPLASPGTPYPFETGKWLNLDGNTIIIKGAPPSGAHSDIVHPHTAWAAMAAAGFV